MSEQNDFKMQYADIKCPLCESLEDGDTLYSMSDWDGGIGFDYIRDIHFCPKCGRKLREENNERSD